jgi:hypothetical protein
VDGPRGIASILYLLIMIGKLGTKAEYMISWSCSQGLSAFSPRDISLSLSKLYGRYASEESTGKAGSNTSPILQERARNPRRI